VGLSLHPVWSSSLVCPQLCGSGDSSGCLVVYVAAEFGRVKFNFRVNLGLMLGSAQGPMRPLVIN
jgi:hypothetical protein